MAISVNSWELFCFKPIKLVSLLPKGWRQTMAARAKGRKPTLDLSVEPSLRANPGDVLATPSTEDVWQVMNALMNDQGFVIKDKHGNHVKDRNKAHKIILRCLTIVAHNMEYNHSLSFLEYKKNANHGSLSKQSLESLLAVVAAMNITGSEINLELEQAISAPGKTAAAKQRMAMSKRYLEYLDRVLSLTENSHEASVSNSIEIMIRNTQAQLRNALSRLEASIEKGVSKQTTHKTQQQQRKLGNSLSFSLNKTRDIKKPIPSEVVSWLHSGLLQTKDNDNLVVQGIGRRQGHPKLVKNMVDTFKQGKYPKFPDSVHDAIGVLKEFCDDSKNYTENFDANATEQLSEIIHELIETRNGFSANSLSHFESILEKFPMVENPKHGIRSRL